MKKTIFSLAVLLLTCSTLSALDSTIKTKNEEFPKEQMKAQNIKIATMVAKEIASTLPKTIDKYTTFSAITSKGSTLVYTFKINTGAKSDESVKKEDRSRMKKAITTGICQSSEKFLQAGINTSYIYISEKSSAPLFRFDITQKDCIK